MTDIEELCKEYLIDFEDSEDVDDSNQDEIKTFQELSDVSNWSKLIDCNFEEEQLKALFSGMSLENRKAYFSFAVNCMNVFVQSNFTGPDLPQGFEHLPDVNVGSNFDFRKWLSVNSEDINVNVKHPSLLCAAICIFKCCHINHTINLWWQWRTIIIHQNILEELSSMLLTQADQLQKEIANLNLEKCIKIKFEIEQAQLYNLFRIVSKSEMHLLSAQELLGLKCNLVGKLGKRTKHQAEDIAQLALDVAYVETDKTMKIIDESDLPKKLVLDDDIRLDTVIFKNEDNQPQKIPYLEQQLLLAIVENMIISKPQDDLYYEEVKPFLDVILLQQNTWAIRIVVLLIRTNFESKHKRTIERCLLQTEEIINSVKKVRPNTLNRISGFYRTNFPPIWKSEEQLANIMLNIGMVKAALDLYLKLQLWEEVIVCYTILGLRHKATEIIKEQLNLNPTVKLWCLLGDATDDISCYETAWEFSKKRSSRSQRQWGHFLFVRKQYDQCIPHFEKSLSINPLQATVWFIYGYAALQIENWQAAATAYRRYTSLEPGNFEAWNNLAKAYIKMGNKHGAYQALLDALKCNYENWKVWDNFMAVSADTSHFSDVIRAYHRILDLKGKHLDVEILTTLVCHVQNNMNNSKDHQQANLLTQKTRELLGRLSTVFPTDGHVWDLYANLAPDPIVKGQRLLKAFKGFTQRKWDSDSMICQHVLHVCYRLGETALSDHIKPTDLLLNSVKLNLTSAIAAIKKHNFEELQKLLKDTGELLTRVIEKLQSRNVQT